MANTIFDDSAPTIGDTKGEAYVFVPVWALTALSEALSEYKDARAEFEPSAWQEALDAADELDKAAAGLLGEAS